MWVNPSAWVGVTVRARVRVVVKVTVKVTVRITVRVSGRHVGWIHAQKEAREARNMPVCAIYPLRVIVASEA